MPAVNACHVIRVYDFFKAKLGTFYCYLWLPFSWSFTIFHKPCIRYPPPTKPCSCRWVLLRNFAVHFSPYHFYSTGSRYGSVSPKVNTYVISRSAGLRLFEGCKLPPGPPRRPLIGNLLDIPRQKEWQTYHKWSKIYG